MLLSQSTNAVVQRMKTYMARYGIPDVVVTDNGPQFDSNEFKLFEQTWSLQHITSSPCYSQSNGGIERAEQSAKTLMKKAREDGEGCYLSLLNQRNTPRDEVLGSSAINDSSNKDSITSHRRTTTATTSGDKENPKAVTVLSRACSKRSITIAQPSHWNP